MSSINLNCLGSFIYRESISNIDKRKLSFSKIKQLSNELLDKLSDNLENIRENRIKNDISYIDCLKNILLLCYLNNIDINRYISLKIKNEKNK